MAVKGKKTTTTKKKAGAKKKGTAKKAASYPKAARLKQPGICPVGWHPEKRKDKWVCIPNHEHKAMYCPPGKKAMWDGREWICV
jgi:hypothetical protein